MLFAVTKRSRLTETAAKLSQIDHFPRHDLWYRSRRLILRPATAWLLFCSVTLIRATAAAPAFQTPFDSSSLDPAAFAQWVDGAETPITVKDGPRHVVWTRDSSPEWDGVSFGDSKNSGPRHLRLGWLKPIPVGSVLVRAGGRVSALKPGAAYPGRLDRDEDWLPAQRLHAGRAADDEAGEEDYSLWVLPPGTTTRALRFTHTSSDTDKTYAGWLGGVFVLRERMANVAPFATPFASGNSEKAAKLINENNDSVWGTWDAEDPRQPISPSHPAWITLVWPRTVKLRGLNALWPGFSAVEVQRFSGDGDPIEAQESAWQRIAVANVQHQYPRALAVNWIDFGSEVTTRAMRVLITKPIDEQGIHEHLRGKTRVGRRVWFGELLALQSLGNADLASSIVSAPRAAEVHPPIPIRFNIPEEGFVTLVIDDAAGHRVRNLIAETKFPAGENVAWWDGTDDLLRDPDAARHGLYHIPAQFVSPGSYLVKGLWRKQIDLRYEFSIYNAGHPAWETADKTGAWLANHTPPSAAMFVPARRAPGVKDLVYLGSFVSEGGHGLAWVDLDGRKVGGVGWVGGTWTGAAFLARDDGPNALTNVAGYAAAPWSTETYLDKANDKHGEIRLTAITPSGNKLAYKYIFTPSFATNAPKAGDHDWFGQLGGFAAWNGVLAFTLTKLDQVVFVATRATNRVTTLAVNDPRGLAFDSQGRLLVVSGRHVVRFPGLRGGDPVTIVTSHLDDPRQVALDSAGRLYVSDHGASHQVKVFGSDGIFVRAIGRPGVPHAGPYDPLHMNHPFGLTIDSRDRLWVTENDFQPKRVSVWTLDGQMVRAFYGPSEYGGGGKLDPEDKTKFYYHGMEFRLDWDKGSDQLVRVFHRPGPDDLPLPDGFGANGAPEQPHYVRGRRYFSNHHNSNPTGGPGVTVLWLDDGAVAQPVAAFGRAHDWKLLKGEAFRRRWPAGVDLEKDYGQNAAWFTWSDLNGDHRVQPEEVTMRKGVSGSITVAPDLSMVASRIGSDVVRFAPVRFTDAGVPVYDVDRREILTHNAQGPASSGGDQALWHPGGWTVLTTPPKPFSPLSVGAVFKGDPRWSYPSLWPGLHASHESPPPDQPGEIIGTTRLLGDFITPRGEVGPVWCENGNQGNMYLFTADGLFIAGLFQDVRRGRTWSMPAAPRGTLLNGLTLHDENFWPSITQTRDGNVYLCDGARTSLVRVDGLDTIRRFPELPLNITAADLAAARTYFTEAELRRQSGRAHSALKISLRDSPPAIDGQLDDWADAQWVDIDKSGVAAFFDSKSKPFDVRASLAVAGDRLYVAFRTGEKDLLRNAGEDRNALFKTGGALDLMLGTNPQADPKRSQPVAGDVRLLVTEVKGRPVAMLYRAVVPGTTEPVPFSSPWRTITIDRVEDVSSHLRLAGKDGDFEFSIPLSVLGVRASPGLSINGDVGILRGNAFQTLQRVYWSNKASGITADVPSEAELTPRLWGRVQFTR